jgi:hypothetical protein
MVFGVLFGFRRSDFRSSDYSPKNINAKKSLTLFAHANNLGIAEI